MERGGKHVLQIDEHDWTPYQPPSRKRKSAAKTAAADGSGDGSGSGDKGEVEEGGPKKKRAARRLELAKKKAVAGSSSNGAGCSDAGAGRRADTEGQRKRMSECITKAKAAQLAAERAKEAEVLDWAWENAEEILELRAEGKDQEARDLLDSATEMFRVDLRREGFA